MARNFDSIKPPKAKSIKPNTVESGPVVVPEVGETKAVKRLFNPRKHATVYAENVHEPKKPRKLKKIILFVLISLGVLLFLIGGVAAGAFAHNKIYQNKVFPGVTVWGEDVGGRSFDEVAKLINNKVLDTRVKLVGPDQEYEANATDLGILIDSESMALSAFSRGRTSKPVDNYLTRARLMIISLGWDPLNTLVRGNDLAIEPNFTVNDEVLDKYLDKISQNINISAKDSQVTVEKGVINVVPAVFGREVQKDNLKASLLENIKEFKPIEIAIQTKELRPAVIDKAAEEVKIQTESVISRPITLTFEGQTFKPNKETVASWITYTKKEGSSTYDMIVDPGKMKNYFAFLGTKINIYPTDKKIRVENGAKETVIQEGSNGRLIDEKTLGNNISQALPNQAIINIPITTYVANFKTKYEQVLVANWDKYIDVNISTQTMTAYLKGGEVVGSWKVTTGKTSTPTPIGTWLVHGKSAVTRMTGGTRGIDYYDLPNVHWVTWFKGGGYSIHEAYWRTSFGGPDYTWSGSHGCVNSPLSVAQFIYDWAPIGTPVIVHY